ncbi:putative enoyl-CoA hydratase, mitochondrial [Toxocara canis]|uniref:Putative enoyl-CoA hydratase, mitochondrial n=1 Tax=Toxocara canis TaxID=6265 RepID=A0A0B2VIP8_TOXCA|nr:putative enoyl-CoA hydratase, mitochondrial [Toxocara canis]
MHKVGFLVSRDLRVFVLTSTTAKLMASSTNGALQKAMEMIRVEKVRAKNNVAIVQLNRPNVLNALCEQLRNELTAALKDLDKDDSIGAIVITSSESAFAVGADIKEMQDKGFVDMYMNKSAENLDDISAIRKPIIAAVNGFALGGSCAGGTQRWPRVAGKLQWKFA